MMMKVLLSLNSLAFTTRRGEKIVLDYDNNKRMAYIPLAKIIRRGMYQPREY